ncbi:hypothetical protein KRMM14A1004_54130 [Krasilnikovia sp. MM14-A1004]
MDKEATGNGSGGRARSDRTHPPVTAGNGYAVRRVAMVFVVYEAGSRRCLGHDLMT